jgi:SAM-dependent methyltransferase
MIGWDHPKTADYYEEFCARHDRYDEAGRDLVRHAELVAGFRVLDLGAGTGRTAELILPTLGGSGSILCVEPALAMKSRGEARLQDCQVQWVPSLPTGEVRFDRIVCSAAIWHMAPFDATFSRLRGLLRTGGIFCFNIPGLYLGEPDEPGEGKAPDLIGLTRLLGEHRVSQAPTKEPLPDAQGMERLLAKAGFWTQRWTRKARLTQEAYRDWLKIPVITDWLLGDLDPDGRAVLIEREYRKVDPDSWRWENWTGWVARPIEMARNGRV